MHKLQYAVDLELWQQVALALHAAAFSSRKARASMAQHARIMDALTKHLGRSDAQAAGPALLALDWRPALLELCDTHLRRFHVAEPYAVLASHGKSAIKLLMAMSSFVPASQAGPLWDTMLPLVTRAGRAGTTALVMLFASHPDRATSADVGSANVRRMARAWARSATLVTCSEADALVGGLLDSIAAADHAARLNLLGDGAASGSVPADGVPAGWTGLLPSEWGQLVPFASLRLQIRLGVANGGGHLNRAARETDNALDGSTAAVLCRAIGVGQHQAAYQLVCLLSSIRHLGVGTDAAGTGQAKMKSGEDDGAPEGDVGIALPGDAEGALALVPAPEEAGGRSVLGSFARMYRRVDAACFPLNGGNPHVAKALSYMANSLAEAVGKQVGRHAAGLLTDEGLQGLLPSGSAGAGAGVGVTPSAVRAQVRMMLRPCRLLLFSPSAHARMDACRAMRDMALLCPGAVAEVLLP